jgi:hypothetical protein
MSPHNIVTNSEIATVLVISLLVLGGQQVTTIDSTSLGSISLNGIVPPGKVSADGFSFEPEVQLVNNRQIILRNNILE